MSIKKCFCGKLSLNKKSIFGLRMRSQILYLLLFASYLVSTCAAETEASCASVKSYFERKGILSAVDFQELPNSDAGGLCLNQGCCGVSARPRLTVQAKSQLEGALRSELNKLADVLSNRAKRFDDFFHKLLQLSREGFHNMFKRTYGMIYEQHSYVFEQLFEQLEKYYSKGETGFEPMMDSFFGILYQKMFTVLNAQYTFDEKYLKCVNDHMRDYQPFEDMPHKLSVQLRRAFVATRTFHKALRGGASVLRNMVQVGVSPECVTAWARLRFCGQCAGAQPPACSRYCHNVVKGCLPLHADLGEHWDAYVDAVEKVADRLLGPFNIAMVVEPLDIKISEAIMSFQDHNQEISQKIFADCGKPVLGGAGGAGGPFYSDHPRARRSIEMIHDVDWHPEIDMNDFETEASYDNLMKEDPALFAMRTPQGIRKATEELEERARLREEFLKYMKGMIKFDDYQGKARHKRDADPEPGGSDDFSNFGFNGKRLNKKKTKPATKTEEGRGGEWGGPELSSLVREARARLRGSRRYWSHLPAVLCSAASVTTSPCFNGTSLATYTLSAAGEGSAALASNPEVRGTVPGTRTQQDTLKMLTAKLKDAYNGVEVQWKEADDLQQPAASERMSEFSDGGSGSGDDIDDTDDDNLPDDDEDSGKDFVEGSGSGSNPSTIDEETPRVESGPPSSTQVPPLVMPPPGNNNNVHLRGRVADPPDTETYPGIEPTPPPPPRAAPPPPPPPPADSSSRPTLQQALFTYALPVVCAWFGTILTDLF